MSIAKRGRLYHLRRRVPRRYRGVEPRETVWISLHTDSESVAHSKADRAWSQMIEAWEARLAGNSEDAEARYEAARDLAQARGFRYLDAGNVAKLPVEDVVERIEAIPAPANQPDPVEAAALLGTVPEPRITVTKALQLYWGLAKEKTLGKSEDQLRRWEAPRKKAVKNFVAVVGDKEIANITRDDMLDFRQHWLDRIEAGEVTANSANKDLIHLSARQILEHTADVVDQRREAYGPPDAIMAAIAACWSLTLGRPVSPAQVKLCMIDLKLARLKAYTNYDNYVGVGTWTKIGLNNTDYNDQGAFDAANNHFVAPVDGTYLFGATLLYKINATATARMRGRLVLNGATEIRGSFGESSATHVTLATSIWLQTMVPLTAGDTVELQGYFRVADGYFAADHTSFWGCKVG